MNLNCLVCLKEANILYKGSSLCSEHYLMLEESGRGDTFLEVIIKRYIKNEQAKKKEMLAMSKKSDSKKGK